MTKNDKQKSGQAMYWRYQTYYFYICLLLRGCPPLGESVIRDFTALTMALLIYHACMRKVWSNQLWHHCHHCRGHKITKFGYLGIWASCKCNGSVKFGKKLVSVLVCLESSDITSSFPWVLLLSLCASMQVQFMDGNKTRAGTINIATLPRSFAHCTPSSFSLKEQDSWSY